jgi:hypothetical protein
MLVRERLAIGVIAATWMGLACSSTPPRDINYGSDVGAEFTPPDVGARKDVQVEESGTSVDNGGGEVALDASPDASVADLDASIGGSK